MKLSEKELKDLVDNIKYHLIEKFEGTDYDEDEDEYLYCGQMYYYKATFETLEYESFIEGGEYSHVEVGHREMTLNDVEIDELNWIDNEGDLETIF
jgi:hypothetical protein